jgi:hypothetical protein
MSTVYQQMKRGRRIGRMILAAPVVATGLLLGSCAEQPAPETGPQADGSYRVVDLQSHLEMCENPDYILQPETCRILAYQTWAPEQIDTLNK